MAHNLSIHVAIAVKRAMKNAAAAKILCFSSRCFFRWSAEKKNQKKKLIREKKTKNRNKERKKEEPHKNYPTCLIYAFVIVFHKPSGKRM